MGATWKQALLNRKSIHNNIKKTNNFVDSICSNWEADGEGDFTVPALSAPSRYRFANSPLMQEVSLGRLAVLDLARAGSMAGQGQILIQEEAARQEKTGRANKADC